MPPNSDVERDVIGDKLYKSSVGSTNSATLTLALEFGAAYRYFGDEGNRRESSNAGQHPGVVHGGCQWWVLVVWKQEMNDGIKALMAAFSVHDVSRSTCATLAQLTPHWRNSPTLADESEFWEPPADIPQFVKGGRYSDAAVDDTPNLDNSGIMRTELKPADGVQVTVVRSAMTVMEYWWEECSDRSCEGDSVFAGLGLPTHGTDVKESLVFAGLDYPEHRFEAAHRHNGLVREGRVKE
ncbi:hypothetical protein B0H14DRAFT_3856881 [Mycena olivaceomarginata]|nr:hypothetical protein B0H14DRAFT_3856881 [Mycena olivaceomarginata]